MTNRLRKKSGASDNIKYLGVTLAKQVRDLCNKNLKIPRKISEDGKISHAHGSVGLI